MRSRLFKKLNKMFAEMPVANFGRDQVSFHVFPPQPEREIGALSL